MTNEAPGKVGHTSKRFKFLGCFLDPVFTHGCYARIVAILNKRKGMGFCNSY